MSESTPEAAEVQEVNASVDHHEQNDGEGILNFDEIESLTETKSDEEAVKEATAEVKADVKPVAKKAEPKTEQELDDKQAREEELSDEIEAELIEEIKLLKAKKGDKEYEIDADAMFTLKVNGEEVEVPLSDLQQNYSGKVAWDKKFQELGEEKKLFNGDKEIIEKYVSDFAGLVQNNDRLGAMEYLAQLAGQNPIEFRKSLREQMLTDYQDFMSMDDTQKQLFESDEQVKYLQKVQESENQRKQSEQTQAELNTQIQSIQEAHSIDDKAVLDLYEELTQNYEGEITPELIGQYHVHKQSFERSESVITEFNSELAGDEKIITEIATAIQEDPEITNEDILEVLAEAYGEKQKSRSKKVESAKKPKQEEAKESGKARNKLDEFYSFEEL